jgi:transposase
MAVRNHGSSGSICGPARPGRPAAQLLGLHRHTVSPWLARYEAGGLDACLALYGSAGKPPSRPPHGLAAPAPALPQPAGFASYEARRQGVEQTSRLGVNYPTLYAIVRTTLKITLKVPRPTHTNQP